MASPRVTILGAPRAWSGRPHLRRQPSISSKRRWSPKKLTPTRSTRRGTLADHVIDSEHAHSPNLRHHFDDMGQQFDSATFGMWVFLLTEIMFFGGMFGAYTVYRSMYPEAFAATSNFLNPKFGAANNSVLIVSRLTMALAVRAAHLGQQKILQIMLVLTMIFGTAFLVIKGFEYHEHWEQMKVPLFAGHWSWDGPLAPPQFAHQAQILFCFYFFMTGFHAVHM